MEWGDKENRIAVIALHKVGMEPNAIFKTLHTLGISQMFVYRAINRYNETSSVCDRKRSGRPRSVRTKKLVKAVRERIRRNPVRKQKILSREMKIAPRTMSRILKDDLGLAAYKRRTGHFLTDNLKKNRVVKSKKLLKRYAREVTEKFCLRMRKSLQLSNILTNKMTVFMLKPLRKLPN